MDARWWPKRLEGKPHLAPHHIVHSTSIRCDNLYTFLSQHQVTALLNELGLTYESKYIDFANKPAEFLKVAPNGRIPAIVDHHRGDKVVWESVAILLYLEHHYDKDNKFWFTDEDEISEAQQWLLFQASGIGPYFGQKVHETNRHCATTS